MPHTCPHGVESPRLCRECLQTRRAERCPHGILWPHECGECLAEIDPHEAASWLEEEMSRRNEA